MADPKSSSAKADKCQNKLEGLSIDDLSSAAARGNLQLVQKLLKKGINVNEKNTFGSSLCQFEQVIRQVRGAILFHNVGSMVCPFRRAVEAFLVHYPLNFSKRLN